MAAADVPSKEHLFVPLHGLGATIWRGTMRDTRRREPLAAAKYGPAKNRAKDAAAAIAPWPCLTIDLERSSERSQGNKLVFPRKDDDLRLRPRIGNDERQWDSGHMAPPTGEKNLLPYFTSLNWRK